MLYCSAPMSQSLHEIPLVFLLSFHCRELLPKDFTVYTYDKEGKLQLEYPDVQVEFPSINTLTEGDWNRASAGWESGLQKDCCVFCWATFLQGLEPAGQHWELLEGMDGIKPEGPLGGMWSLSVELFHGKHVCSPFAVWAGCLTRCLWKCRVKSRLCDTKCMRAFLMASLSGISVVPLKGEY